MTHEAEMVTPRGAVPGVPPSAATMAHLRSSNWAGGTLLSSATLLTVVGVALSLQPNWWLWLLGQAVLAATMVQWFALLHECGHGTLFRSKGSACTRWLGGWLFLD